MGIRSEIQELVEQLPEDRLPEARRVLKAVQAAAPTSVRGKTLAELVPDFFGCIKDGPSDASTSPKYLDGLGE